MDYIEIQIELNPFSEEIAEIFMAELADAGCDSFETLESSIKAYVPQKYFNENTVKSILNDEKYKAFSPKYEMVHIKAQNWNAVWESNFEPIILKNKLLIKAPFHQIEDHFEYVIEIEPKMSFGTGHHETTSLILENMIPEDFKGKRVLDMGCGTGILAIYAEMLGAKDITAIDIDEWAYENSLENLKRNNCKNIKVLLGDVSVIPSTEYDVIIANINRNVLIQDICKYSGVLKKDGLLFLSGFYTTDIEAISDEAGKYGIEMTRWSEKKNWAACIFKKKYIDKKSLN